jgi:hypothetical protein
LRAQADPHLTAARLKNAEVHETARLDPVKIPEHWSVAYAVCHIPSQARQQGLRMLVGTDDSGQVVLNGQEVYSSKLSRGFLQDEDVVEDVALTEETVGWTTARGS